MLLWALKSLSSSSNIIDVHRLRRLIVFFMIFGPIIVQQITLLTVI
ncbi:hypothetical protein HMPREF9103_00188 [Lentilactobacillus parafarraginis F0439]|uniref:Uncharacterized protein n=1 Tax=Lentilactobacillus parafarraginis F0439 TaxID=797515 RepID=G9ZKE0_9LACO|nr:hypothetical protein HMPREF9103_00188 [Lentilactobacillus parafarraginis F0439]